MAINGNSINDVNVLPTPASPPVPQTLPRYHRPRTLSRIQSNISAVARCRVRRIRRNRHTLIRNASTVLCEVATNQININAEQVEPRAESRPLVNSTNATALSLNLRIQDSDRTLGPLTQNVHLMLRRLNHWKNEVNPNTCSDELLDLCTAAADIVCNAAYFAHDGTESDDEFIV